MNKRSRSVFAFSLIIIPILVIPTICKSPTDLPVESNKEFYSSSGITMLDCLHDPNFDTPPEIQINGDSNEFDWTTGSSDGDNYYELIWNHSAGTELEWNQVNPELPECLDFIYFTQSFDWTYNEIPWDVNASVEFSIMTTGSFSIEADADLMYRIHIWLIDSSGNWKQIYGSFPDYSESPSEIRIDLNYFDIAEAWRGMVQDESGIQEDPEDTLVFAGGLAPTGVFRTSGETHPWMEYNGTVSVRFYSASLNPLLTVYDDPVLPAYSNSVQLQADQLYTDAEIDIENPVYHRHNDLCMDEEQNIYTIGTVNEYNPQYSCYILMKWTPRAELSWMRVFVNHSIGYAIGYANGMLYTAGHEYNGDSMDVYVAQYDLDGNMIWRTICRSGVDERYPIMEVRPDGSVCVYYIMEWNDQFGCTAELSSLDSSGRIQWNIAMPDIWIRDSAGDSMGNTYFLGQWLYEYDSTGDVLWNSSVRTMYSPFSAIHVDSEDNLFTSMTIRETKNFQRSAMVVISKWNSLKEIVWNTTFAIEYLPGFSEDMYCQDICTGRTGSIFAVIRMSSIIIRDRLAMIDPDGDILWNYEIGLNHLSTGWLSTAASDGFMHLGYTDYRTYSRGAFAMHVYPYSYAEPALPLSISLSIMITIASIGVIFVVVGLWMQHIRRENFP